MLQDLSDIPYLFAHRQRFASMAVHNRTLKSLDTSRRYWRKHLRLTLALTPLILKIPYTLTILQMLEMVIIQ